MSSVQRKDEFPPSTTGRHRNRIPIPALFANLREIVHIWLGRLGGRRRRTSVLTRRIVLINLIGLMVLMGGTLFLNQRSQNLIDAHRRSLETQSRTLANALAETAVIDVNGDPILDRGRVVPILRRLVDSSVTHAMLYNDHGELIADSNLIQDIIVTRELAPPGEGPSSWYVFQGLYDLFEDFLAGTASYPNSGDQGSNVRLAIDSGLRGEAYYAAHRDGQGNLIVGVAVPVQSLQKVLGVLLLQVSDIDEAIRAERSNILRIFAVAMIVSVLSSIFLARTIARPVRQLAAAADVVRFAKSGRQEIPTFLHRNDEIGDLSASIRAMTVALYDRIGAIEAFAADVAHEIKNPLTSLRSAAETFEIAKTDDARHRLLGVIKDDVSRIDRLISDISNASRLDAELARTETKPVDIGTLLKTLKDVYDATKKDDAPDIILNAETPPHNEAGLQVSGLQSSLGQVFRNLIDNAISFSPPKGRIFVTAKRIEDKSRPSVVITVEDEGPGIPEENLENIFQRFYTQRPEGAAFGTHSGLGLSITRQIVEAHGGTIMAENRLERSTSGKVTGARFAIVLPAR